MPSPFCCYLIFCQLYAPPVVRTSIHLEADAGPMFRDNIHLVDHFLSGDPQEILGMIMPAMSKTKVVHVSLRVL